MIREKLLFVITKLVAFFLAGCPPQKCRFYKQCELYREDSEACNRWEYRFFPDGRSYCGRYRRLKNNNIKNLPLNKVGSGKLRSG